MAILKLEESGNLKTYLQERKDGLSANEEPQRSRAKMTMDVAKGMTYLAQLKVRNVISLNRYYLPIFSILI